MKKLSLAAFSALALSLTCSSVFAVDGTITVNGVVTDQTCILVGNVDRPDYITGLKDITVRLPTVPKSSFALVHAGFSMELTNAKGTGHCDAATSKVFQGIHLSAISATDLDASDKTLLVNKATDASTINPVFINFYTDAGIPVDISAPWRTQAKNPVFTNWRGRRSVSYNVKYVSKTGIVDAQSIIATVNYTMHYN
ncbi:MAG: fimbrial protein [Acinetobacter guillouiae]